MLKIKLSKNFIRDRVKLALTEDIYPDGDITTKLIKDDKIITAKLISNQKAIVAGLLFTKHTFSVVDNKIKFVIKKKDGSTIKKNSLVALVKGKAKSILIAERVALNFLSHISGIATKTNQFVKLAGKKCKICCTRKTIPNYRIIQKYAVKLGGGTNHRFNLSDEFLIKDNHIASNKNFKEIVKRAVNTKKGRKITVEVDNLKQFRQINGLKFDTVLLDNMSPKDIRAAVKLAKGKYETEASGGISLKNIKKIASTKVDRISVGELTHSVNAMDLKLEI